jgi:hypothetical protein
MFTPLSHVRLTPSITFADVSVHHDLKSKVNMYVDIVKTWLVAPACILLEEYPPDWNFRGMAALSICLQFFEQHGEFLSGQSSNGRSKVLFCKAYERFVIYMDSTNTSYPEADDIYKWARCGLFHSARLSHRLLIDASGMSSTPFSMNPLIQDGWLVNPLALANCISSYVEKYADELTADSTSELSQNFEATFSRLISEPLRYFESALTDNA